MLTPSPAFRAVMSGSTMAAGATLRKRMPKSVRKETRTPDARARIQSPTGMNRKKMTRKMTAMNTSAIAKPTLREVSSTGSPFQSPVASRG